MPYFILTTRSRGDLHAHDALFAAHGNGVAFIDPAAYGLAATLPAYDAETGAVREVAQPLPMASAYDVIEALTAPLLHTFTPVIVRDTYQNKRRRAALVRSAHHAGYTVLDLDAEGTIPEDAYLARVENWDHYRRIIAIGDVQGCATALGTLLAEVGYDAAQDHLVYLGDLFDRGVENTGVYRITADQPEATYIMGNHDRAIREVITGSEGGLLGQARASVRQLTQDRVYTREIAALIDRARVFVAADYAGQRLHFSHGGAGDPGTYVEREHGYRIAERTGAYFIQGLRSTGRTERMVNDYFGGYDAAVSAALPEVWHFHGHRSIAGSPIPAAPGVWGLETRVEFDGGTLTAAIIERDDAGNPQVRVHQTANTVTCGPDTR